MSDILSIISNTKVKQAKIWRGDGTITPSANGKYFTLATEKVHNIKELSVLLTSLEDKDTSCLIRGKYVGDDLASKNDPDYKQGKVLRRFGTFIDQPLHSIMIEVDDYVPPIDNPIKDTVVCIDDYIREVLPECFHNASYHWQLSSSAGKAGKEHLLKVHIWFWLKTPYTSEQLKVFATDAALLCDHSVFNPIQIHFTANPIFEDGVVNPVQYRSGFEQRGVDDVDLDIDTNTENKAYVGRHHVKNDAIAQDPIAAFLYEKDFVKSVGHGGQLHIKCPFSEGHSTESSETSTSYFLEHTGGFKHGAFKCFHQSCSLRTKADFLDKIGYDGQPVLDKQNHMQIAEWLLDHRFKLADGRTLLRFQNNWLHYSGTHYIEKDDEAVRDVIWQNLYKAQCNTKDGVFSFKPKQSDVSGILDALRSVTRIENITPNSWINDKSVRDCVSMKNGILDISSRSLQQHSPLFFTENSLPYDFVDSGHPTHWLDFLNDVFENDSESIDTLQEVFGYCVTPNTSLQKMFMILGPTRSGKGTIARIFEAMLGTVNVSGSNFSSLAGNFGLQPLRGKLAAIFPDVRVGGRSDVQAIVEKLLCITGEDNVVVDEKYKKQWSGIITARLLLISNEVPQLMDVSNALTNRFVFLETRKSYLGNEDTALSKRLYAELPYILNWALDGRERLLKRGKFIQPNASAYIKDDMRRIGSPISAFVEDRCVIGDNHEITKQQLFDAYIHWCTDMGYKFHKHMNTFARDLLVAVPSIKRAKKSQEHSRMPIFRGITLQEEDLSKTIDDDSYFKSLASQSIEDDFTFV
jgi:P4 family phage/plasmid primase-like protien